MSGYQHIQRSLAEHIRDPGQAPGPAGVEARRLRIYADLFYKNVEGFLANGFPVFRSLMSDADWHALVRGFMRDHRCATPYFLEITEEFMAWLGSQPAPCVLPAFTQELLHYEWIELALDVDDTDLATVPAVGGDLMQGKPVISPLAWSLAYRYPVHRIGPGHALETAPDQPTYLVVYRNRADRVQFLEINAASAHLLSLLQQSLSGAEALAQMAQALGQSTEALRSHVVPLLQQWYALDIVLGIAPDS